jgi:hypothetical protein
MVIVPVAFMASAPQGMLATSLNPQTRHFNLAETRHLNFGLTNNMLIIYIMSNNIHMSTAQTGGINSDARQHTRPF